MPTAKTRLLLAEDDPAMVELLRWTFEKEGFEVVGTASGEEALLLASESPPDIVILDWMLEELSGIEVCRRLRSDADTEPVPIIAVTGAPDAMRSDGCLADAVLSKPCELDTFLAAARLFLRPVAEA